MKWVPEHSVFKPSHLYGKRYTINHTVPCWQLACNARARLPSLSWRQEGTRIDYVFFQVGSECIQKTFQALKLQKNQIGSQRVSSETFLTLWAQVHWQLACNDSTRWRSPELAPINNEDKLRFFWKLAQHAFRRHFAT